MNKKQFEKIDRRLEYCYDNVQDCSDSLNYIKVILTILFIMVIIISVVMIIRAISRAERLPNAEDFCNYHFGEGYYYNRQLGEPYEVRSCDYIERDGSITQEFFSMTEYKKWRRTFK